MPPIQYWIVHPKARRNDQQKQELIAALKSSLNNKTVFNLGAARWTTRQFQDLGLERGVTSQSLPVSMALFALP